MTEADKITLSMIVRNNERHIKQSLESVCSVVKKVVVVDTGSTDKTKQVVSDTLSELKCDFELHDFNPMTHPKAFTSDNILFAGHGVPGPFTGEQLLSDYGAARQFGWEKVATPYGLWIDSDDTLQGTENLPGAVQLLEREELRSVFFLYEYAHNDEGKVTIRHWRERLIRSDSKWQHRIHEVMDNVEPFKTVQDIVVVHRPVKHSSIRHRNLKVLLMDYVESTELGSKASPRTLFYLGTALLQGVDFKRGVELLDKYLSMPGAWDEERALAHHWLGREYEKRGLYDKAFPHFASMLAEFPDNPDGYFGCARCYYYKALSFEEKEKIHDKSGWHKSVELFGRGYEVAAQPRRASYLQEDPELRGVSQLHYFMRALMAVGRTEDGLNVARKIVDERPNSQEAKNAQWNLDKFASTKKLPQPASKVLYEVVGGELNAKPDSAKSDVMLVMNGERSAKPSIVFWAGRAWQKWTPDSIEEGLGGSETAMVHMARQMAQRGWETVVYGDLPGGKSGQWDGVTYHQWNGPVQRLPYAVDVLVVSRVASEVPRLKKKLNPKHIVIWAHDVHVGLDENSKEGIRQADKVFGLSAWHIDHLRKTYGTELLSGKLYQTRNGIDLGRFANPIHPSRRGPKAVYTSSPDRGLLKLLWTWPEIRKRVPDAILEVYYGGDLWKASIDMGLQSGPGDYWRAQRMMYDSVEARLDELKHEGVFYKGKVGQTDLAQAFMSAKVWSYPTQFTETSCIGAMEAQAAGAVVVTSKLAALKETVKIGRLIDLGEYPYNTDAYNQKFVDEVSALLTDDNEWSKLSAQSMSVEGLDWAGVAVDWNSRFKRALDVKKGIGETAETAHTESASEGGQEEQQALSVSPKQRLKIVMLLGQWAAAGELGHAEFFEGKGLTGSESTFFNMAEEMARRGHEVTAWAPVPAPRNWRGVQVYPIGSNDMPELTFSSSQWADVLISWSNPMALPLNRSKAVHICSQHLNDFSGYCTPNFDKRVDCYTATSESHRRHLYTTEPVAPSKIKVVPNSVRGELSRNISAKGPGERGRRLIWMSSPDRGLHVLLRILPEIRRRVPDVTLDIFYRFNEWLNWAVDIANDDPNWTAAESGRRARAIAECLPQPGVTIRDNVSNRKMYEELSTARLMAYTCDPMNYTESFSVSVVDACAAGCVPLISDVDALGSLYAGIVPMIPGRPHQRSQAWIDRICELLTDDEAWTKAQKRLAVLPAKYSVNAVGDAWESLLLEQVASRAVDKAKSSSGGK